MTGLRYCGSPSPQGLLCIRRPGHRPTGHSWERVTVDEARAIAREELEAALSAGRLTVLARAVVREELEDAPHAAGELTGLPAGDGQDRPTGERMAIDELARQLRGKAGESSPLWQALCDEEKGRWRRIAVLLRQFQDEVSFHYQQLSVARGEAARLRQQVTALEHRLGKATRLLDDPDTAASQRKRAGVLEEELAGHLRSSEEALLDAEQQLRDAREALGAMQGQLEDQRVNLSRQVQAALHRAEAAERASWGRAPAHAQRERSALIADRKFFERKCEALEREKGELSEQLRESREAIGAMRDRISVLERELRDLHGQFESREAELEGRARELQDDVRLLNESIDAGGRDEARLQSELRGVRGEREDIALKLAAARAERDSFEAANRALREQLDAYGRAEESNIRLLAEAQQARDRLRGELKSLQAAHVALGGRAGLLEHANARLSRELTSAQVKSKFAALPFNALLRELGAVVYDLPGCRKPGRGIPDIFADLDAFNARADDEPGHAGGHEG